MKVNAVDYILQWLAHLCVFELSVCFLTLFVATDYLDSQLCREQVSFPISQCSKPLRSGRAPEISPKISKSNEEQNRTWRRSNLSARYLERHDPTGRSVGVTHRNLGIGSSLFIKLAGPWAWGGDCRDLWYLAKSTVVTGGYFIIVTVTVR